MKCTTKAQRKVLMKELKQYAGRETVDLGKYAAKEYAEIGGGILNELGFLVTGVRSNTSKRRR